MRSSFLFYIFLLSFFSSCAHHRSGQYVLKNGKWIFESSQVGFLHRGINVGRVDHNHNDFTDEGRFIWPVPGSKKVSSYFGKRKGHHHDGIDIPAKKGTAIVASASGVVTLSGRLRGYGKVVVIKHADGYHTVYAHNSKHYVKKGDKVSQGQVVAKIGNTGRSTGPHLHFEIRRKNKVRNPALYLSRLKRYLAKK